MPKFKVTSQTKNTPQEAFNRVSSFLDADQDLRKLDPSYVCDFNNESLTGTAKGKMFTANMVVTEASDETSVEIAVELPMTLALAKGMVQKTLQRKLDETLG